MVASQAYLYIRLILLSYNIIFRLLFQLIATFFLFYWNNLSTDEIFCSAYHQKVEQSHWFAFKRYLEGTFLLTNIEDHLKNDFLQLQLKSFNNSDMFPEVFEDLCLSTKNIEEIHILSRNSNQINDDFFIKMENLINNSPFRHSSFPLVKVQSIIFLHYNESMYLKSPVVILLAHSWHPQF